MIFLCDQCWGCIIIRRVEDWCQIETRLQVGHSEGKGKSIAGRNYEREQGRSGLGTLLFVRLWCLNCHKSCAKMSNEFDYQSKSRILLYYRMVIYYNSYIYHKTGTTHKKYNCLLVANAKYFTFQQYVESEKCLCYGTPDVYISTIFILSLRLALLHVYTGLYV